MRYLIFILFCCLSFSVVQAEAQDTGTADTSEVIKLNAHAFDMRFTDPDQTVEIGGKALAVAEKINYKDGMAEAHRVIGVAEYYMDHSAKAIDNYLTALNLFIQVKDIEGQGRVLNNIGNLYRNTDYDRSLEYFEQALTIAQKLGNNSLIATVYLNLGTVYYHKHSYYQALNYYNKSNDLFVQLKDQKNLVNCMENKGLIYFELKQTDKAEDLLLKANEGAKQLDLNGIIASVDLTLAELYIAESKFDEAEKIIAEGVNFANIVKATKTESDYKYTSYQLELKRKNYQRALSYLQEISSLDSANLKQNTSTQINVIEEQFKQQDKQRQNDFLLQRQEYDRVKFWAVTIVAILLLVFVGLLISNVKRKAKTNSQLTGLNAEVSRQKDNLDRINHHLEEIIDERTKDLQVKNKKLSEYSSYLSHQIRGPIATLKGLLNLEKEGLVDEQECIRMMNKSVGEIDDKIIEMSDMLHDPGRAGF